MFWELGQDIHDDRSLVKASYDAKKRPENNQTVRSL